MDRNDNLGVTTTVVQDALHGMLLGEWSVEDTALKSCSVAPCKQADASSERKSLLVKLPDGTKFKLTIEQHLGEALK